MKRELFRSNTFIRAARKALKKQPQNIDEIRMALEMLNNDAFHPRLKTHKLKGKLSGSWACSAGYNLRIVFKFVEDEGKEAILLETVGTHEEVY